MAVTYWGLVGTAAALAAPLLLLWTFLSTSAQSASKAGRPPQAPYWVPMLGNTVGFAMDTHKFVGGML